jgi:hypothetical protein
MEVLDESAILRGWTEEPNEGLEGRAKQGARRRSQKRGQTGPDGGPDRARWGQKGWRMEGLFTFKRKMICYVYMSYKSSLASDVFDAGPPSGCKKYLR